MVSNLQTRHLGQMLGFTFGRPWFASFEVDRAAMFFFAEMFLPAAFCVQSQYVALQRRQEEIPSRMKFIKEC
jgi:hypothetical protein